MSPVCTSKRPLRRSSKYHSSVWRTVREALTHYFEDRRRGSFDRVHTLDIV